MKLSITIFNQPITFEKSRTPGEEKLRVQKQYAKDQLKLIKANNKKAGVSATYNNCTFGMPYPVGIPQQQQSGQVDEKVIEYAATQTGLPAEYVEKILDAIDQYFEDRRK